ncbi:hypothetical protein PCASD_05498 [Puccinia coronata f. sp. avenae]|uniref:Uncharacterized protein n=1 Tax=Puccinia coronata f. sp. avenae TaxID=200324 RepID=A0A2N5V8U3_9BASI|nr:hypothetical protein PCASD_05498 [Puccinia coronata f. sp. avenae]
MEPHIEPSVKASRSDVNLLSENRIVSESTSNAREMIPVQSSSSYRMERTTDVNNSPGARKRNFPASTDGLSSPIQVITKTLQRIASFGQRTMADQHTVMDQRPMILNTPKVDKEEKMEEIRKLHLELWERYNIVFTKVGEFKGHLTMIKELFPDYGQPFEKHISDFEFIASYLYKRKLKQLEGHLNKTKRRKVTLHDDLTDRGVWGKAGTSFLSSFDNTILNGVHRGQAENDKARLFTARWSVLMMGFFRDCRKYEMLPESSVEYGSECAARFFSSYVLGKFPPYDVATTYLNLDLRRSILEDRNIKRLKQLSENFDEVTWEYIEFRILAARLEHEEDKDWGKHFDLIMNAFLERSQDRKDWFFEIMSLFQILITYIPKVNFSADKIQEQLVHFKVVYDMLKFIQRYNPEIDIKSPSLDLRCILVTFSEYQGEAEWGQKLF